MTAAGERRVRCPLCVDEFLWPDPDAVSVFNEKTSRYELIDISRYSAAKQGNLRANGYVQCPNPSGDMAPHYLPASYADYQDPLIVGIVGAPRSGKTHLLTAMIRAAHGGGLKQFKAPTKALDLRRHRNFQERYVHPLERGDVLAGTDTGITEPADILLVGERGRERPVTFFDVAGEDFDSTEAMNRATRFLVGANAMIFVHALEDRLGTETSGVTHSGWSFEVAMAKLQGTPGGIDRIPAAIVVTKSDRLRHVPPIAGWLRRDDLSGLDAELIRRQSRDVYAYLHSIGAAASLRPYETFSRCTLHFVSASGADAVLVDPSGRDSARHFARGVRPVNVLAPLIAILAMTGVISGPAAEAVGRR